MSVWPTRRLGDIAPLVRRPVEVNPDNVYREIGVRSFGKGIFHKAPVTGLELGDKRVFRIAPGDLVFNIVFAWEGAIALAESSEAGMIGSHRFLTCVVDEGVTEARFLKWWFAHPAGREQLLRASPGGAGRNRTLGIEKLAAIEVPLPSLDEQRRIVARIEDVHVRFAEVCTCVSELASLNDAMLAALVSRKLVDSIPVQTLGDLGEVRGGIQKTPLRTPGTNPVRYLTVAHVQRNKILHDDPRFFEVSPRELDLYRLHAGDVLIIEGNGSADQIGRTALFRGEIENCVHQNHVIRIRPKLSVLVPEYLNAFLNSAAGREAVQSQARSTSGLRTLSVGRIRDIAIPLPSLCEQRRVVAELDALQAKVDAVKALQVERAKALDALLPAILDRAFKGEL